MLRKATRENAETHIDFAWELAQDPARSGYPTYTDGIKTRADFEASCRLGVTDPNREVLLYEEDGTTAGWIQFTFLEGDKYLQTEIFNISGSMAQALAEFTAYCERNFHGYTLYLGFPAENTTAMGWLAEHGWTCLERSYNDVMFFDGYEPLPEEDRIQPVTKENFGEFRALHAPIEGDMYWNSDRLEADLDNWAVYLYHREGKPAGAIYYMDDEALVEVFGIDFAGNAFDETIFRALLTRALNACKAGGKKYMVFFNDAESQKTVLECGFTCVGQYVLHIREI